MKEEIGPKLNRLKEERTRYVEFQGIERELEHSKRIYLAWKYITAFNNSQKIEENVKVVQNKIDSKLENIAAGEKEIKEIETKYTILLKKKEEVWFLLVVYFFSDSIRHIILCIFNNFMSLKIERIYFLVLICIY